MTRVLSVFDLIVDVEESKKPVTCKEEDNVLYIRFLSSNKLEAKLNGQVINIPELELSDMHLQIAKTNLQLFNEASLLNALITVTNKLDSIIHSPVSGSITAADRKFHAKLKKGDVFEGCQVR